MLSSPNRDFLVRWLLLASVLALGGCETSEDSHLASAEEEDPTNPGGKGDFYGEDDRNERYQASDSMQQWARSTALVTSTDSLFIDGDGNLRLATTSWSEKLAAAGTGPLCEDERFRDQPAPGFCSAFLIAPDLVATAGHCVNETYSCEEIRFVFDFAYDPNEDESDVNVVPRDDFYQCRHVVGRLYDQYALSVEDAVAREYWSDWAVVQLDRAVVGRPTLTLRPEGQPQEGQAVFAIGHPGGIPSKVTAGKIVDESHTLYFNTDLDIFGGNSGSAAFNTSGEVEGIVIRGTGGKSFVRDGTCFRTRTCEQYDPASAGCTGNHVMRVDALRPFLGLDDLIVLEKDGAGAPIPDGQGQFTAELPTSTSGKIRFVTANLLLAHNTPSDLHIRLVHGANQSSLFERPKMEGPSSFSATTHGFDGEDASGTWTLIVEDMVHNGNAYSKVYDIQLVLGVGNSFDPSAEQTFIGTPCVEDEGCTFHPDAYCHRYGDESDLHGFCSLPCEGYCPDRAGFAPTFCTSLDQGTSGSCVSKAHQINSDCTYLSGTTAQNRDRFIGTSTASASQATVCAP